jgi:hypothetical protein
LGFFFGKTLQGERAVGLLKGEIKVLKGHAYTYQK